MSKDPCKLRVQKVQNRLGLKKKAMEELIDNARHAIASNNDLQEALKFADYIFEKKWCISAFDLINKCCEDIINTDISYLFSRRSDNGESSQNGVDHAISSLVYLARVFFEFDELGDLGDYLEKHFGEIPELVPPNLEKLHNLLNTYYPRNANAKKKEVEEIVNKQRSNLDSGMVSVDIFNKYKKTFQTLLFISEVTSYVLDWTAKNNIRILVAILVLSATCCLSINIPLILRWWRNRSVRVISHIEWVESSFSIFLLGADILKVADHDKAGTKVMETWFVVFAAIGYVRLFLMDRNANVDGSRSSRVIRN